MSHRAAMLMQVFLYCNTNLFPKFMIASPYFGIKFRKSNGLSNLVSTEFKPHIHYPSVDYNIYLECTLIKVLIFVFKLTLLFPFVRLYELVRKVKVLRFWSLSCITESIETSISCMTIIYCNKNINNYNPSDKNNPNCNSFGCFGFGLQ